MREGKLWLLHLLAGFIMFFLLGSHIFFMHMAGGEPLSVEATLERAKNIAFPIVYTIFVAAALYHGLYGLRGILYERFHTPLSQKVINWTLSILGTVWFLYALATTWIPFFKY